jgi:hypothetical protein
VVHGHVSRPDLRELFMSLSWFGQGVIWVGSLCSAFYVLYFFVLAGHVLCSIFYVLYFFVLAGYGSQSGTAVYCGL